MKLHWRAAYYKVKSVVSHLRDADIRMTVYSLSFVTLLSLAPLCVLSLGFFKYSGFLTFLYPKVEALLIKNMTGVAGTEVSRHLQTLVRRSYTGSFGFLSISFLIFTTNRLAFDLERAVNRLWHVRNPKNVLKRLIRNWSIIFMFPIALGTNVAVRSALSQAIPKNKAILTSFSGFFLLFILWGIFHWLPNDKVKKSISFFCALISTIALFVLQSWFSEATKQFYNYNKFYGSLATLPLFLIWISAIWFAILFGVGLGAGLQKAAPFLKSESTGS